MYAPSADYALQRAGLYRLDTLIRPRGRPAESDEWRSQYGACNIAGTAGCLDWQLHLLEAAEMLLSLALLPSLLFAELTVPPGPKPHADAIRTLAEAHAVVLVASKRCADLFASEDVNDLQRALGLTNADSAEAYSLLLRLARQMNANASDIGEKAWCDEIYVRFGPDGTMMKALLKRCDPKAENC